MENDNIKQSVNSNNGSQSNSVSRFGNSSSDKKEKDDIRNRIDGSRSRNLNQNSFNNSNLGGLGGKVNGLDDNNGLSNGLTSNNKKTKSKDVLDTSNSSKGKSKVSNTSSSSSKRLGFGKSLLGGLGRTGLNKAAEDSETASTVVNTVNNVSVAARVVKWMIAFFSTPIGWVIGALLGVVFLIFVLVSIIAIIVNSLGMKFGLSGNETLNVFNGTCPEGYSESECEELRNENIWTENMTQEEIESLMSNADSKMCKQGFSASLRHFFGIWKVEGEDVDQCELAHYIKHILEEKQDETTIDKISPGYFMSSLYYAFDSQNRDENGDLFLNPSDFMDNKTIDENKEVNDLDAISTVMAANVYNRKNLDDLLDNYIFPENMTNSDFSVKRSDGSNSTIKGYYYRVWTYYPPETPEEEGYWDCEDHRDDELSYSIDDLKFKLYLRYGQKVVDEYVNDKNENIAYNKTSSQCQIWTKHDMSKYEVMANPDTTEDDNAKVTISSGTYGYDSGFIYKTYPKYDIDYTINHELNYSYKDDKDIEQIIRNIESRQDYTNYILGYPNNVKTQLSFNRGSSGGTCTYNIGGVDMSDVKVRLLYGKYDPDGKHYKPIEGQELLNFEDYITGVVYNEIGAVDEEAMKVQAIAARTYAFFRTKFYNRITEEDGQWIINIVNSDEEQTFCDPNKGCAKKCSGGYNVIFTEGSIPAGVTCEKHKSALPEDSVIRKAVRETAGMILLDNNGEAAHIGYRDTNQNEWKKMAKNGLDYEEILQKAYPDTILKTNTCTILASGWVMPLPEGWSVSSCFGLRSDPFTGETSYHSGIDMPMPQDTPIYSIGDGKVIALVPAYQGGSLGNYVTIDHGNGYISTYGHMNKHMEGLSVGQTVKAGQQIGYVGTTGRSTGDHLHLMIKYNNQLVNPFEVMGVEGYCR